MTTDSSRTDDLQKVSDRALIIVLSVSLTVIAFAFSVGIAGPTARRMFGAPPGFDEDFTSSAANSQALLVQTVVISISFFLLGIILSQKIRRLRFGALWVANPVTVSLAFALYKFSYHYLHWKDYYLYEYFSLRNAALLAVAGSVLFALCSYVGSWLSSRIAFSTVARR